MKDKYSILNNLLEIDECDQSNYVEIYIKDMDLRLKLHKLQLQILTLYNGYRSIDMVYEEFLKNDDKNISFEKLKNLENKALSIGLLLNDAYKDLNDPFVGIEYGFSKKKKQPKTILKISHSDKFFENSVAWFRTKMSMYISVFILFFMAYVFFEVFNSSSLFIKDLKEVVYMPFWIFLFYPVWFIVMLLHEFSHAISCRLYNIHVDEVGIGRRGFLFVGWVKPYQSSWSKLPFSSKLVTILVGPLINILISSIGLFGWIIVDDYPLKQIMLSIGVLPLLTMIPTLIPTNKGDAYLILTEYFNTKELYSKSLKYILGGIFYKEIQKGKIRIKLFIYGILSLLTRALMQIAFLLMVYQSIYVMYSYLIKIN